MAKLSMIQREKKRARTVAKYATKRAALKEIINDRSATDDERWKLKYSCKNYPGMRARCDSNVVAE